MLSPAAFAQQTSEEDIEDDESIITLSPFEIEAETGWIATETLAGSRLKTDFKDIAAQVDTMTMDFMDDFAVNSVEEALIYSANVSSPEDRITGNGDGFGTGQINNFSQIRGIGGGTNSREFFAASMPTDNYNLSRVTIASGPQSILFGTGSPAGVLDVSLSRASLTADGGKVEASWDNFGSHRYVFDYNKVVIEDVLGLRVAALNEDRKMEWEPNFDKEERVYATATFRPFKRTTLSVHYEEASREPNRVNRFVPFDNAQAWIQNGSPAFDNGPNADWSNLPEIFNRGSHHPVLLIDDQGNSTNPISYRNTVTVVSMQDLPGIPLLDQQADNWTLTNLDLFPDALLDSHIAGLADVDDWDGDHLNIFFEQQLAKNWFINAAYNKEELEINSWSPGTGSRTINVDPNLYLPDGVTPNPHFGEFYTQGNSNFSETLRSRENWRVLMSYELDFTERSNWFLNFLGRQRFGGMVSEDRYVSEGQQGFGYRMFLNDVGDTPLIEGSTFPQPGARQWASNGSRRLNTRQYLTAANGYFAVRPNLELDGRPYTFVDSAGVPYTIDPINNGLKTVDGHRMISGNGPQMEWQDQKTSQISYQGFFWDNRIVLTYGYRDDESEGRDTAETTPGRDTRDTGLWPYFKDVEWGGYREAQSGETSTRGIIVRPVEWVSFFYNDSDTWQPNIGRWSPYGHEYPGAEGEGEDYGVRLDLFDNKLSIKWNEFDMTAGPSRAANTPFNRWRDPVWNVENRWRQLVDTVTYPGQDEGGFRERGRALYWVMSDNTSKGREISIQASPIRNLNLRFTYSDREAIESNIALDWFAWVDERLPVWQALNVPEGGWGQSTEIRDNDGNLIEVVPGRDMNNDGTIGTWTWDTAWYNNDNPEGNPDDGNRFLSEYYNEVTVGGRDGASVIKALDGKANEFDRAKRWNFNVSYRFSEGRLKGFTVGGAARWRDAPLVGYASIDVDGNDVLDLATPYYGGEDFKMDAFVRYNGKMKFLGDRGYNVQLNVSNILGQDDVFPVIKGINGNNTRYARNEGTRVTFKVGIDL